MNYEFENIDIPDTMLDEMNEIVDYNERFYQILEMKFIYGDFYYLFYNPFCGHFDSVKVNQTDEFLNRHGSNLTPSSWTSKDKREVRERVEYLFKLPRPPLPENINEQAMTAPFVYDGWLFAWQYFPEMKRWELAPLGRR